MVAASRPGGGGGGGAAGSRPEARGLEGCHGRDLGAPGALEEAHGGLFGAARQPCDCVGWQARRSPGDVL